MTWARWICTLGAAAFAVLGLQSAPRAQQIGATTVIQNDVSRLKGSQKSALASGDTVFRDETVQTGADALAKIVFLDQTNLSIGPSARVSLNQYVYSADRPAGKVALNLLKGTYRFVTGDLDKKAYEINTPVATIGVRGTVFDVATTGARSIVTLLEGAVTVCTRRARPQVCVVLNQAGQVAIVTAGSATVAPSGSGTRFAASSFSGYCGASPALCAPTRLADKQGGGPSTAVAALCGR